MKTSYTCNMLQGGVLWKMNVLNMLFYKGDKTKVCDMVCVWVRDALVLVSAHHSEWVHPPSCLSCCAFCHISGTSLKRWELFLSQGRFPASCLPHAWGGKGSFPQLHDPGRTGGRLCLESRGVSASTRMRRNNAKSSSDLSYSNMQ